MFGQQPPPQGFGAFPTYDPVQAKIDQEKKAQAAQIAMQKTKDADTARRTQSSMNQVRSDRNKDLAEGRARGAQEFGDGSLGRVDAGRSADMQDIVARRKEQMNGYTADEQNAIRSTAIPEIQRQQQAGNRALRVAQARSGVYGPAAAAQQASLIAGGQGQMANAERDLFLKNTDMKRSGLDNYQSTIGSAEQNELAKTQYNQSQGAAEKAGRLSTEMGYGQLGSAERSAVMQKLIGEDQLASSEKMAKEGGGKK